MHGSLRLALPPHRVYFARGKSLFLRKRCQTGPRIRRNLKNSMRSGAARECVSLKIFDCSILTSCAWKDFKKVMEDAERDQAQPDRDVSNTVDCFQVHVMWRMKTSCCRFLTFSWLQRWSSQGPSLDNQVRESSIMSLFGLHSLTPTNPPSTTRTASKEDVGATGASQAR